MFKRWRRTQWTPPSCPPAATPLRPSYSRPSVMQLPAPPPPRGTHNPPLAPTIGFDRQVLFLVIVVGLIAANGLVRLCLMISIIVLFYFPLSMFGFL